ncbi:uncharacterized protein LOC129722406 [Wyeomyia smithii]|uniref:uncharacterized protein LOC129722406 n=1 Tax=Wyeomyia smithii TaxID=174621 RepID=UPI002467C0D7|nr:uncharacterized protein LOC129722406 [Wyeomyia smithii]
MAPIQRLGVLLLLVNIVIAETSLQPVSSKAADQKEARQNFIGPNRFWPWGWGWGWGWAVAIFVLAIVKGSILLGIFVIWAFFKSFGKAKHGCAPIIIRESPPPYFHHEHHPWDRTESINEYPRVKRSADYTDSALYWTDMVTDLSFSFLGVHSRECRKRFVCEVDVRARNDPMLSFAMNMFGRDIFRRYRSIGDKIANSFEECSKIYNRCKFSGPSITFNVVTGNTDPMQDYDESVQEQLGVASSSVESSDEKASTEEVGAEEETTQATVTTTIGDDVAQKRYAFKRKRYFKLWKK